jgi:hypothetical protein
MPMTTTGSRIRSCKMLRLGLCTLNCHLWVSCPRVSCRGSFYCLHGNQPVGSRAPPIIGRCWTPALIFWFTWTTSSHALCSRYLSCFGDRNRLKPPSPWNTLSQRHRAYCSSNISDVGLTIGPNHLLWFTFQTPSSGCLGVIIFRLGSSDVMKFFPHIIPAWLARTKIFFSSKYIMFTFTRSGSTSSFILCPLPNVNQPSFRTDCTYQWK